MSKTNIFFIKTTYTALLCLCGVLFYGLIKNYTPHKSGIVYSGQKYSIAGENTQGLCQLINGQICQKKSKQKYSKFEQTLCNINLNCTSSKQALHAVLSGSVDMASVASKDIKPDMNIKALMHISTDQKIILVSRPDFSLEDGFDIVKNIHGFITSIRNGKSSFKKGKALKIVPFYGGDDALERYIKLDKGYALHSGLVHYYMPRLETPLTITYGIRDCEPGTNLCTYISEVANEDYKESNRIATMGKGIIPYLKEAVKSNNDFLVMKAAHAMGRIWPREPDLVTLSLLELLDHSNDKVKEQAIFALSAQQPLHPKTIDRLIDLAESDPIEREGFSDSSHGMSQTLTVLRQMPISERAAYGLAITGQADILPVLYKLAKSQNPAKQTIGINAINQYLSREKRGIIRGLTLQEKRKQKERGFYLSKEAREAIKFLKDERDNFLNVNKKNVGIILARYPIATTKAPIASSVTKQYQREVYDLLYTFNTYYDTRE